MILSILQTELKSLNFRLGKMDNDDVMWEEISAALGQVALLTKIIIEKVRAPLLVYRLKCSSVHRHSSALKSTLFTHWAVARSLWKMEHVTRSIDNRL